MSILEAHNVRIVGLGEQLVVLGHGFGTDQSVWKEVIPHLLDDYRLILYDTMGAGTTNPDYFSFQRYSTLHGYADDLLALLDELEVESCIYIGHSVSGMVGCLASIERPYLFSKIIMISASPRYLNDVNYFGGFEQEDLNQLFEAMQSNFKAWVSGFAPLAVGADIESEAVQEFSRTLFNIRPDIAFSVAKTIFQSDLRCILPQVVVPCHILQSLKDLAVPVVVSDYLKHSFGGKTIVEVLPTDGHLPQLSSPDVVVPVLLRHIMVYTMFSRGDSNGVLFSGQETLSVSVKRCRCDVPVVESDVDCFTSSNKAMGTSVSVANGTCPEQSEGRQAYSSGAEYRVEHGNVNGADCGAISDTTPVPSSGYNPSEGERTDSNQISGRNSGGAQSAVCYAPPRMDGDGKESAAAKAVTSTGSDEVSNRTLGSCGSLGAAATILGIPPGDFKSQLSFGDKAGNDQSHLPHSVLQVVATSLQCDLIVAAILQNPLRLAETVLCVPRGMITVPLRFSKSALAASARCEVLSTDSLLLPSMLTARLGARPKRFLATLFHAEGYEGLCYSLWLDPAKVPDVAETVMAEAGQSLPLLLASSVRALCCDRMGRRFDVIMKKMPQAVAFVDDGRGQCLINPTAADLLGLPGPGEYDTRKVANGMRHLADRSIAAADVYRCINMLAGKPNQTRDWIWELKHPRSVLRVRSYPISNVATHGRVWLFDDVTSERDAHDAIEEANKAKSQFLAMMSHELRTPMTGVLGMLDLLRLTSLTEEQARFMRVMQGSAEGLMQVLNEILDFSKIQSGHLALENVNFRIDELLEQVSALFQGRLAERKLYLTVEIPSESDMYVYGDPNRLRQVLSNLVSNAIKFTEEGGIRISWNRVAASVGSEVSECSTHRDTCVPATSDLESLDSNTSTFAYGDTVSTTPYVTDSFALYEGDVVPEDHKVAADLQRCSTLLEPQVTMVDSQEATGQSKPVEAMTWFEVKISDTGIGLTREQQSRLFQSFSQADSSTTRKFGGTGLGLAICKGVVEVMGGKIWVESEPGKGSTFAFRVPLSSAAASSDFAETRSPQRAMSVAQPRMLKSKGQTLKVLVAEDNMVNQLLIRKMLKHYGHEVELVVNGQLAVEAIQVGQHDMILMDLQMPVLDGLSATKAIRALGGPTSEVPIYALTADVLTKGKESLEAMGLTGYLTKPINWDKLYQVLDEVVHDKCQRRCWPAVNGKF